MIMIKVYLTIALFVSVMVVIPAFAGEKITVVGQNVQNFFYSLDRTRTTTNAVVLSNYNTEEGRTVKLNAIVGALAPYKADIYTFNEVEAKPEAMQLIATVMSQKTGLQYQAIDDGFDYDLNDPDNANGVIKSGYIYNTATIKPHGESYATGWGFAYQRQMRLQTFEQVATGERFALSINHFKAGGEYDEDNNGVTNREKRINNMTDLLQALGSALDPDILVVGDLNSMVGEECLNMIEKAGYEEQILKYAGSEAYTHCFNGGEIIDHVYANNTMAQQVTDVKVLPIANPCSVNVETKAYSDHNPYLVELDLKYIDNGFSFVKSTSVIDGGEYLMIGSLNNKLVAASPVPENKSYAYLYTTDVEDIDGVITVANGNNIFTFEDAGQGLFYIKDSNGRYLLQNPNGNKYYVTVAVSSDKAQAHPFSVTLQADGTFKIQNSKSNDFFQCTIYNGSTYEFALWSNLKSGYYLPYLYCRMSTTGIRSIMPYATTMANVYYNLSGQRIDKPVKGLYIRGGRKVYQRSLVWISSPQR